MAWKFDQQVANIFDSHARQHIPDYDRVLGQTVSLCNQKLLQESAILEIGCAVGETVKLLHQKNFVNIHAVDSSAEMLAQCPSNMATYYHTVDFPNIDIKFHAVICNWTLHFIKHKRYYLEKIYQALEPGGFLILSEKTENSGLALEQYHQFKRSQGVSDEEIVAKAQSLETVMFIDTAEWYQQTLRDLGFHTVTIFNANWCFTSFVAVK